MPTPKGTGRKPAEAIDATRAKVASGAATPSKRRGGRQKGTPKTGGRQKGTPNNYKLDPMTENLNTILGAIVDVMPPAEFLALSPVDVLMLCQRIAMQAHSFHMTVAVAEKVAPYKHARVVAAQPAEAMERRVRIEGGIGEIKPVPIPVDPSMLHEGSDAIN
jgi:hypothetical protein